MPRELTEQQRDCLKRVAENKKNETHKQLYHKDRYFFAECAACSKYMTL